MGIPVLILGESGSGKSTSLRNFEENEVKVLNVASKPLPFRKQLPVVNHAGYKAIFAELRNAEQSGVKKFVIDDSQYLMCFEMFAKCKETGYTKFTDTAKHFYDLIQLVINSTPNDCIVYFLHHTEQGENGKTKAKTSGKMLDSQLTLEGLFSIVLMSYTDGQTYKFITQSDGTTTVKSPMEMFNREIDNDLKFVDNTIREYYNLKGNE